MIIEGVKFIKINCEIENCETIIAVKESDVDKINALILKYNDEYNEGEVDCDYVDYLNEYNADFVIINDIIHNTIEL